MGRRGVSPAGGPSNIPPRRELVASFGSASRRQYAGINQAVAGLHPIITTHSDGIEIFVGQESRASPSDLSHNSSCLARPPSKSSTAFSKHMFGCGHIVGFWAPFTIVIILHSGKKLLDMALDSEPSDPASTITFHSASWHTKIATPALDMRICNLYCGI